MARLVRRRPGGRSWTKIAGLGIATGGIVLAVLAATGAFSAGPSTVGDVHLVTAATVSPPTPNP